MIKGTIYEKDYEYEGCIHQLIFLVTKVSYQEVCKRNKFKDNGYSFVKDSKEAIKQIYNAAKDEVDTLLLSVKKEEILEEIKNLRTIFKSKKIDLKRESKKEVLVFDNSLDKSFYIEYINILEDGIDKMLFYLKELKNYYQSLESEYIDSKMALYNIFERSTELQPVGFYQYLVTKKGFNEFYNRFKPSDEEMSANDMSYDEDKKVITYNVFNMDEDGGSYNSTRHKFIDFILGVLKREASKSLLLVKAKFEVSGTHDEFSFYLKRTIDYLKDLINKPDKIEEEYFEIIKEQVNKLIKQLQQKYKSYLKVSKDIKEETKCFFKLKGDKSELRDKAIDLHIRLCKHGFLKQETKKMFVDLFTGKPILEKITWKKPKNHLKLFVDLLINKGLIEGTTKLKGSSTSAYFKLKNGGVVGDDLFSDSKVPKDPTILTDIISNV